MCAGLLFVTICSYLALVGTVIHLLLPLGGSGLHPNQQFLGHHSPCSDLFMTLITAVFFDELFLML